MFENWQHVVDTIAKISYLSWTETDKQREKLRIEEVDFSPRDKKVETGLKFKHGMEAGKEIALLILPMSESKVRKRERSSNSTSGRTEKSRKEEGVEDGSSGGHELLGEWLNVFGWEWGCSWSARVKVYEEFKVLKNSRGKNHYLPNYIQTVALTSHRLCTSD